MFYTTDWIGVRRVLNGGKSRCAVFLDRQIVLDMKK